MVYYDHNTEAVATASENDYSQFYDLYQAWRNSVYEVFVESGDENRARKWLDCHNPSSVWTVQNTHELPSSAERLMVCSNDPEHEVILLHRTCDDRCCPECAYRASARLMHRYIPKITEMAHTRKRNWGLRHIVLTSPFDLRSDTIREDFKTFMDWTRDIWDTLCDDEEPLLAKGWREDQGLIIASEFGEDGYKLHAHVLHWGPFIPQQRITEALRSVSQGAAYINYVRFVPTNDEKLLDQRVGEILKYAVKFWKKDLDGVPHYIDPELLPQIHEAMHHRRRIRSYGVFYRVGEVDPPEHVCSVCQAHTEVWTKLQWEVWRKNGLRYGQPGWDWFALQYKSANNSANSPPGNDDLSQVLSNSRAGPLPQTQSMFTRQRTSPSESMLT